MLVDDGSDKEHLGKHLDDYVAKLDVPVRVIRMGKWLGVIKAR